MYAYGNHHDEVGELARQWLERSWASLGLHFPEPACRALDALIEGWTIHQFVERRPLDRALVHTTVTVVAEGVR